MTLVSEIIQQAYREINIIPIGSTPTTAQSDEALARLNAIVLSAVGNEIAEPGFREISIGGDFDQSDLISEYIPDNVRLVLNIDGDTLVGLNPNPYEGQRFSVVDVLGNVATNNVTIDGNGRNIEGSDTLTLAENGVSRQWLYRSDTCNWVRVAPLVADDQFPFPEGFNDYFVAALAMRLSPRYGQSLPPETIEALKRSRSHLRNRYRNRNYIPLPDHGLIAPHQWPYGLFTDDYFEIGRDWPWVL